MLSSSLSLIRIRVQARSNLNSWPRLSDMCVSASVMKTVKSVISRFRSGQQNRSSRFTEIIAGNFGLWSTNKNDNYFHPEGNSIYGALHDHDIKWELNCHKINLRKDLKKIREVKLEKWRIRCCSPLSWPLQWHAKVINFIYYRLWLI